MQCRRSCWPTLNYQVNKFANRRLEVDINNALSHKNELMKYSPL